MHRVADSRRLMLLLLMLQSASLFLPPLHSLKVKRSSTRDTSCVPQESQGKREMLQRACVGERVSEGCTRDARTASSGANHREHSLVSFPSPHFLFLSLSLSPADDSFHLETQKATKSRERDIESRREGIEGSERLPSRVEEESRSRDESGDCRR